VIKVKYDSDIIKLITLFESMTGAKVKDCISGEKLTFIVEENNMGRAIGRNGSNIKRLENALKKKIKLAEFSGDSAQFVRNLVYPADVAETKNENGIITVRCRDSNTRAMLIGRNRQNISGLNGIVKRFFDIKEVKIA
jgi:transcription termination/antitermination protein NusA